MTEFHGEFIAMLEGERNKMRHNAAIRYFILLLATAAIVLHGCSAPGSDADMDLTETDLPGENTDQVIPPDQPDNADEELILTEDAKGRQFTREEWINGHLRTDFGFRKNPDPASLSDDKLLEYMNDAYTAAYGIFSMYYICSDIMYGCQVFSSDMPMVEIDSLPYNNMHNPVFPTLEAWESYMRGILSDELTDELLSEKKFISHEGELWGVMGARGTDIRMKTVDYEVKDRSKDKIVYTAIVEIREDDLDAEIPDEVKTFDFTYSLTDDGWRWTEFYLYH